MMVICRWTAPSEASTVKVVATVVKVCFYILFIAGASFESQDVLQKIIPSHIFQTAVQQKCQVTASNGNGNDDGSDEGGSIEPSSSTSVSITSFLLIASIIVLSI